MFNIKRNPPPKECSFQERVEMIVDVNCEGWEGTWNATKGRLSLEYNIAYYYEHLSLTDTQAKSLLNILKKIYE
jgi:hypothetical protein